MNYLVVYAKTDKSSHKCLSGFIIETNRKGFKVGQKLDKLGMRGSGTSEIVFDNYEVFD